MAGVGTPPTPAMAPWRPVLEVHDVTRGIVATLVAIALLFAGSVATLYVLGGGARRPAPASTGSTAPRGAGEVRSPSTPADVPGLAAPAAPPVASAAAPHRAPEPQEVMPPSRRVALASFRRELIAGLADLDRRLAPCASRRPSGGAKPGGEPPSFILAVESVAGGVRVTEVRLESSGGASDADVACARSLLRDHVIPARSAEPGRRWQLRFSPRPRG